MFKITTKGVFLEEGDSRPSYYAVVRSAKTELSMSDLKERFVGGVLMDNSSEPQVGLVTVESIKHPLGVFKNYGGDSEEYLCVLPQRKWSRYFGDKIAV